MELESELEFVVTAFAIGRDTIDKNRRDAEMHTELKKQCHALFAHWVDPMQSCRNADTQRKIAKIFGKKKKIK